MPYLLDELVVLFQLLLEERLPRLARAARHQPRQDVVLVLLLLRALGKVQRTQAWG
jgi:hypothetical protein